MDARSQSYNSIDHETTILIFNYFSRLIPSMTNYQSFYNIDIPRDMSISVWVGRWHWYTSFFVWLDFDILLGFGYIRLSEENHRCLKRAAGIQHFHLIENQWQWKYGTLTRNGFFQIFILIAPRLTQKS